MSNISTRTGRVLRDRLPLRARPGGLYCPLCDDYRDGAHAGPTGSCGVRTCPECAALLSEGRERLGLDAKREEVA